MCLKGVDSQTFKNKVQNKKKRKEKKRRQSKMKIKVRKCNLNLFCTAFAILTRVFAQRKKRKKERKKKEKREKAFPNLDTAFSH